VQSGEALREGSAVSFKVLEFNKENKRILLSHTMTWEEANAGSDEDVKKFTAKKSGSKKSTTTSTEPGEKDTLGDLSSLAGLKQTMVDAEEKSETKAKKPAKKKADAEAETEAVVEPTNEAIADDTTTVTNEAAEDVTPAAEEDDKA